MKRREFLVASAIGAVSTFAGSVASAVVKKPANAFIKTSALKNSKTVLVKSMFKGAPRNVLVTKTAANKYIVLDATCTHEGCLVRTEPTGLRCPCHGAEFDALNGAVLGGPAMRPLPPVAYSVKSGWLCFK